MIDILEGQSGRLTVEQVRKLYAVGLTQKAIGDRVGRSASFVCQFMKLHGIQARDSNGNGDFAHKDTQEEGGKPMGEPETTRGKTLEVLTQKQEVRDSMGETAIHEMRLNLQSKIQEIEAVECEIAAMEEESSAIEQAIRSLGFTSPRRKKVMKAELELLSAKVEEKRGDQIELEQERLSLVRNLENRCLVVGIDATRRLIDESSSRLTCQIENLINDYKKLINDELSWLKDEAARMAEDKDDSIAIDD